ncbi:hypothetical protein [Flavobacterium pectinovorum]|uniref:Outer membrane protein beta-barrel domain-containing protein n=1 Tax=Flavobacterium pectinovorum TaxID=29533 RepID=A0AB36P6V6_9FLAO|nr:hypothetical protein [Flavobacterium pectinovorum]OXB07926.1 hypothetical protein B0A72_03445 [Flavobacterium pectinovorum]SHM84664.1 hypothetical protein SAMN05444387_3394 [Flavobacterium pectinovorum]
MKKQNIEDIFSSMENFSSVPPPELWSQIEEKLDKPKKKKRAILWWSAAACLLLGLMLPTVLHFSSDAGIKTIDNSSKNNNVVLDEKNTDLNDSKTRSIEENNIQKDTIINEIKSAENAVALGNSSEKETKNISDPSKINQNQKTTVSSINTKNKSNKEGVLNGKSNLEVNKPNQAVAEKSFAPNNENGFNTASKAETLNSEKRNSNQAVAGKSLVPNNENTFNSPSKFQIPNTEKVKANQAVAEKSVVPNKINTFNSGSKNQFSNIENAKVNQAVAEKSVVPNKTNSFNSGSKNQFSNIENAKINQAVAEKSAVTNKTNTFNSGSKNQFSNIENAKTNQAVAEKSAVTNKTNTFNSGSKNQFSNIENAKANQAVAEKSVVPNKTNSINSGSENQTPSSIFEDKLNLKNENNLASNPFNSALNKDQKTNTAAKGFKNEIITNERAIADNQKSTSKFGDALSKQDSVQLAELQNLEKGIVTVTPETKKEKEDKAIAKNEKWAVEVFAGVANSENYKNDKTLGNVNDSKQSNSYGVKTKYKINKKWAVSSGVKFNELGQSIANVSYMRTTNAFLTSSDYFNQNATVATSHITNNANYIFVPTNTIMALKSDNLETGKLDQNLRYLEVPLEVSYSIFNKNKTNISLNTGGFVGKLISNDMALNGSSIGENVNANDYVYGSLLSTTVQYRIYKKTNVFVEPAMNYYINPLSEQSFNQFQWGLNFGLNVSF